MLFVAWCSVVRRIVICAVVPCVDGVTTADRERLVTCRDADWRDATRRGVMRVHVDVVTTTDLERLVTCRDTDWCGMT